MWKFLIPGKKKKINPNYVHEEVSGNSSESNDDSNKHGKAEKEM